MDAGRALLKLGSSGIPLCFNCIGLWLQFAGLRLIMTVGIGPGSYWFGIGQSL